MRIKKIIFLVLVVHFFLAKAALAECILSTDYSFPLIASVPTSDRVVSTSAQGASFGRVSLSTVAGALGVTTGTRLATCSSGETLIVENNESTLMPGDSNYFSTTAAGFGIRFTIGPTSGSGIMIPSSGVTSFQASDSGEYSLNSVFDTMSSSSKYLSYGWRSGADTVAGGERAESGLAAKVITSDGKELIRLYFDSFNVIVGSCRVTTTNVDVNFGDVPASSLQVAGRSGRETNFNIGLRCSSTQRAPSISFDGMTDDVHTTVFSNQSGDGYAEGVGVQLLKGSDIVTPRENVVLQVLSPGVRDYEFTSRLFSLDGKTTEGAIDISVIFTMTYE